MKNNIKKLNKLLVNLYILGQNLRYSHWNIKGNNFITHHEFFGELYNSNNQYIDEFAERIRALGGIPITSLSDIMKDQSISEIIVGNQIDDIYPILIDNYKYINQLTETYIGKIDSVSEDMLIGYKKDIEKNIWFMRSIINK